MTDFPILQFGASRFLQAHVDLFVSEALPRGEAMGRIAVAGTTGSPESRRRIAAFATGQPYPVLVKGLSDGAVVDETVSVSSIGRGVDAATPTGAEVERLFVEEARWIVSNTGDRGYELDDTDAMETGAPGRQYFRPAWPSCCTPLPARNGRRRRCPCELIGGQRRQARCARAAGLGGDGWLRRRLRIVGSTRIASGSTRSSTASSRSRWSPRGAEPYALWAIEDQPGLELPAAIRLSSSPTI